jgi:hypothetical protein
MCKTFTCFNCQGIFEKNPRLKDQDQQYCGSKNCQQARKNLWERTKRITDTAYSTKRLAANKRSYSKRKGDKYQAEYRKTHPRYCEDNLKKQLLRNQNRRKTEPPQKIVNTDALNEEGLIQPGLYVFFPCGNTDPKKIVNTDAFYAQILATPKSGANFTPNTS